MFIESDANPKVQQLQGLLHSRKKRKESDVFVLESPKVIREYLEKRPQDIVAIICAESDVFTHEKIPVWVMKNSVFDRLASTVSPQKLMALCHKPAWKMKPVVTGASRFFLLDGVRDPHNLGAVLRNMKAFGVDVLLLSEDCVDVFHPKVCRAAAGAVLSIPCFVITDETVPLLNQLGARFSMITAKGEQSIGEISHFERQVFIFGSEGQGVSDQLVSDISQLTSIHHYSIEMASDLESLNISVASGIVAQHLFQKQKS